MEGGGGGGRGKWKYFPSPETEIIKCVRRAARTEYTGREEMGLTIWPLPIPRAIPDFARALSYTILEEE